MRVSDGVGKETAETDEVDVSAAESAINQCQCEKVGPSMHGRCMIDRRGEAGELSRGRGHFKANQRHVGPVTPLHVHKYQ